MMEPQCCLQVHCLKSELYTILLLIKLKQIAL